MTPSTVSSKSRSVKMFVCGLLLSPLLALVISAPIHVEPGKIHPVVTRYATKIIMPTKHLAYVVPVGTKPVAGGPVVTKTVYTPEFIKTVVLPVPNHGLYPAVPGHSFGNRHTVIAHPDRKIYTLYGHKVNGIYPQSNVRRFYGDAGTKVYVIYKYNSDGHPIYTAEDGHGHTLYAVKDEHGHIVYTLRGDEAPFYATEDGHVHIVTTPGGIHGHAVHSVEDGHSHTLYISRDDQGRTTIYKGEQRSSAPRGHEVTVYAVEGGQEHAVYTSEGGYDSSVAVPSHEQGRTVYTLQDGHVRATVHSSVDGRGPGVSIGAQEHDVYKIETGQGQTVYTSVDGHILTISAPEGEHGHTISTAEEDNIHTLFVTGDHGGTVGGQGNRVYTIDHSDGHSVPIPKEGQEPVVHVLPTGSKHIITIPKDEPTLHTSGSSQGSTDTGPTLSVSGSSDGESVSTPDQGPIISTDADINANAGGGTIVTADVDINVSIESESNDGHHNTHDGGHEHDVHEGVLHEDVNASSGHDSGNGNEGDGDGHADDAHNGKHGHAGSHGHSVQKHGHGGGEHKHGHHDHGFDFFWHKPMFGHDYDKHFPGHKHGHGHHR